jgi:hypothetical protein
MICRRDIALGGLLSIGWLAVPCGCPAHGFSAGSRFGCDLAEDDAIGVQLRKEMQEPLTRGGGPPKFVQSGDRDLDYAMAQTLSMLTDTWNVLPGFAYFDETGPPNAFASSAPWLARADGSVIFGRNLLARLLKAREQPDVGIAAVVAHEYGHITQYKYNLKRPLLNGQDTVKRLELHADFLAGYFAGRRKLTRPDFPAAVFATTQYAAGDFRTDRASHHGTPDERANAIVKGFETAFRDKRSPSEALQIGVQYAQTL